MPTRFLALTLSTLVLIQQPAHSEPPAAPSESPEKTTLRSPTVSVPMDMWGPRPVVSAKINGKGPFRFCLDLGTSVPVIVDDGIIKQLGIKIPGDGTVPDLGKGMLTVELDDLSIGDAEFSTIPAGVADLDGAMPASMAAPLGILGMPFFKDCLLTLDFPGRRVILESGELPAPDGEVMAYTSDKEQDYGVTLTLTAAGVPVKAHIDTGSPGFLTLLNEMQAKLPLTGKPRVIGMARTPSGESEVRAAKLDGTLKLGPHEFANPSIDFADLGPMKQYKAGNIGGRLLREFEVTVDQKNQRVRFRRPGPGNTPPGHAP